MTTTWRLYIDESGDHTYKHIDNLDTRYLGLTGVLILKQHYRTYVQPQLEALKQLIFKYDPDDPPILVRSLIKHRKQWFYVLQDQDKNNQWEYEILKFVKSLKLCTQVFTVVIDKKAHLDNYPFETFDPYAYSLHVLLNRVRGFLVEIKHEQADVMAESRGKVEDQQITRAYEGLMSIGSHFGDGVYYKKAYPNEKLLIKSKDNNIAGLQLADIFAFGQKILTIQEKGKPYSRTLGGFTKQLNDVVNLMVNQYGKYLLE